MKDLNKFMIIPVIIGIIAGLTYLLLDTTIKVQDHKKDRGDLVEEDFYQKYNNGVVEEKVQNDVGKGTELEEEISRNLTILELVKKEEKKINEKLQTATNIKFSKGLKFFLEKLNSSSESRKQEESQLIDSILEVAKEKIDNEQSQIKSDNILIEINEEDLVENQQKKTDEEEQAGIENSIDEDFFSWLNEGDINQSILDDTTEDKKQGVGKDDIEEGDKEQELKKQASNSLKSETKQDDDKKKEQGEIKNKLFLGIKDGYVAIYKGDNLEAKELLELRKDIPVKKLSEKDKKELLKGIEVASQEELLSILEGFISANEE